MDLNLDLFECPICVSLFQGSIFQCKNGHAVCDACRARIHGTCPSCLEPVGDIRCRPLESVIAGMALPCSFQIHGCTRLLRHAERRDHEALLCRHAPSACPFQRCAYSGSGLLLYDHIRDTHADYQVVSFAAGSASACWVPLRRSRRFKVLLDAVDRRVLLLLNGGDVRSGRSLSMVCLGAADQSLEYMLEVGGGEPGALSLSASGSVPYVRSWAGQHPADAFLFVPDAYWTSLSSVIVVSVQVHALDSFTARLLRRLRLHASLKPFDLLSAVLVLVFSAIAVVALLVPGQTSSR